MASPLYRKGDIEEERGSTQPPGPNVAHEAHGRPRTRVVQSSVVRVPPPPQRGTPPTWISVNTSASPGDGQSHNAPALLPSSNSPPSGNGPPVIPLQPTEANQGQGQDTNQVEVSSPIKNIFTTLAVLGCIILTLLVALAIIVLLNLLGVFDS